jgi:hypothetical protein
MAFEGTIPICIIMAQFLFVLLPRNILQNTILQPNQTPNPTCIPNHGGWYGAPVNDDN